MSEININSISGSGNTFGDDSVVHNVISASTDIGYVLTRDDYYNMLLEIWDLGRISVGDYLEDKYQKHIGKNPHFVELLYRDMHRVMDGVLREEDGDLSIEDGDIVMENGDFKTTGHTNNFFDAMTWLDMTLKQRWLENLNWKLPDPIESYLKQIEDFEKHFLDGGQDSPTVQRKLKELNEQLKAERASFDPPLIVPTDETASKVKNEHPPKAFISYAWDDETKAWVKELASKLRADGINAIIDQWQLAPGDQLTDFMERAVRENDYVLVVCTPQYKIKSDNRKGGVGYEGDIMTAEVFQKSNHRKYIPILKTGTKDEAMPTWLAGKYYVDLSNSAYYGEEYKKLVTTIFCTLEAPPPLGQRPSYIAE